MRVFGWDGSGSPTDQGEARATSGMSLLERAVDRAGQGGIVGSGRLFWWSIWLVFLANPAGDILAGRQQGAMAVAAWLSLAAFAALYLLTGRHAFRAYTGAERIRNLRAYVALMAFTVIVAPVFGPTWVELSIYLGVATGATIGAGAALPVLALLAAYDIGWAATGASSLGAAGFVAFMTLALGATMIFIRQIAVLVVELRAARSDLARLAVDAERLRFARDLHDVLGHSLSVIALKAQVARRLMTTDAPAASTALADLEAVTHESLGALREIVSGYRQPSLADELAAASDILEAAGLVVEIVPMVDPLGEDTDRLLAWAVREGVTNVLRHSRARACRISIGREADIVRLEVTDDGIGGIAGSTGNGLRGLRERMAAASGEVVAGPDPTGGFRLAVMLPVARR